jgi:hypothetical protein
MRTLIAFLTTTVALMAEEATNAPAPPLVTTNYVKAHKSFRRVDGKLYNIEKSVLWHDLMGNCATILTNGIIVQTVIEKRGSYVIPPADSGTSISNILAGGKASGPSVQTRKWLEEGPPVFLINYDGQEPVIGNSIRTKAMRVGTYTNESGVLEKWDCGTPNIVPVIVTNLPARQPKTNRPPAQAAGS